MFPRVPTNGRYLPREMAATSPQPHGHHPATCHGPNTPTRPGLAVVPRTLPPRARPLPPPLERRHAHSSFEAVLQAAVRAVRRPGRRPVAPGSARLLFVPAPRSHAGRGSTLCSGTARTRMACPYACPYACSGAAWTRMACPYAVLAVPGSAGRARMPRSDTPCVSHAVPTRPMRYGAAGASNSTSASCIRPGPSMRKRYSA